MAKYKPIDCGPLAVGVVNDAMGWTLRPGLVHFSASAQEHAEDRHPADYALCIRHIGQILQAPDWVGQGPKDREGFVMVRRVAVAKAILLVAIKLKPDVQGRYVVASTYRVSQHDLEGRVAKGYWLPV
ncbi:hypothetical protein [uncultured Brevundimonas sp.]|uniref:hypothetical protein n=1 Tax=uncultured Brevundimonas sp. TaxID=213418 RepID=UPI0025F1C56D|nr:hypothetical protein [uncultured Brevundimonas sp.]